MSFIHEMPTIGSKQQINSPNLNYKSSLGLKNNFNTPTIEKPISVKVNGGLEKQANMNKKNKTTEMCDDSINKNFNFGRTYSNEFNKFRGINMYPVNINSKNCANDTQFGMYKKGQINSTVPTNTYSMSNTPIITPIYNANQSNSSNGYQQQSQMNDFHLEDRTSSVNNYQWSNITKFLYPQEPIQDMFSHLITPVSNKNVYDYSNNDGDYYQNSDFGGNKSLMMDAFSNFLNPIILCFGKNCIFSFNKNKMNYSINVGDFNINKIIQQYPFMGKFISYWENGKQFIMINIEKKISNANRMNNFSEITKYRVTLKFDNTNNSTDEELVVDCPATQLFFVKEKGFCSLEKMNLLHTSIITIGDKICIWKDEFYKTSYSTPNPYISQPSPYNNLPSSMPLNAYDDSYLKVLPDKRNMNINNNFDSFKPHKQQASNINNYKNNQTMDSSEYTYQVAGEKYFHGMDINSVPKHQPQSYMRLDNWSSPNMSFRNNFDSSLFTNQTNNVPQFYPNKNIEDFCQIGSNISGFDFADKYNPTTKIFDSDMKNNYSTMYDLSKQPYSNYKTQQNYKPEQSYQNGDTQTLKNNSGNNYFSNINSSNIATPSIITYDNKPTNGFNSEIFDQSINLINTNNINQSQKQTYLTKNNNMNYTNNDVNEDRNIEERDSSKRRPMNGFMLFAKETRIKLINLYPGKDNRLISVYLGKEWKSLSKEERNNYTKRAKEISDQRIKVNPLCWKRKTAYRKKSPVFNNRKKADYKTE